MKLTMNNGRIFQLQDHNTPAIAMRLFCLMRTEQTTPANLKKDDVFE